MRMPQDQGQLDRVSDRFTRTADDFSRFALIARAGEAEMLATMAVADLSTAPERAMDVACGPGTFTRSIAAHARFVIGLDYTAAMLAKAHETASQPGLAHMRLVRGDGNHLPIPDGALDVVTCGYSLHHFADAGRLVREMARVTRRGGRVAVADLIVPDGCESAANNRIEIVRDPSHVHTHTAGELRRRLEDAGLTVRETRTQENVRLFDDWMQNVSRAPGSEAYRAVRELMEADIGHDHTGFHPRWRAEAGGAIKFVQTTCFVVGERH
jgi:ubiquinone/menaquinone biosynthesis C-methylase UbiE